MAIFDQPKSTRLDTPAVPVGVAPGSDKIASSREAAEGLIDQAGVGKREMLYQRLKVQRAHNEITGRDYLKQLENIAGTVTQEDEQAKWQNELQNEKLNVLREDQAREDQRIQLAVKTGNMSGGQAASAYKALATQAMAAGDIDSALGYELSSANILNAVRVGGGGGTGKGKGTGSKASKAEYKSLDKKLRSEFESDQKAFTSDITAIKAAMNSDELTQDQGQVAMRDAWNAYKAATYGTVSGEDYNKYLSSGATENQKWEMLNKSLEVASFFKGGPETEQLYQSLSDGSSLIFDTGLSLGDIDSLTSGGTATGQSLNQLDSADVLGQMSETEEEYGPKQEFTSALFPQGQASAPPEPQAPQLQEPTNTFGQQVHDVARGTGQAVGGFAKKVMGLFGR